MKNKLIAIALVTLGILGLSSAVPAQLKNCTETGAVRSVTKSVSGNFETVTFEIAGNGLPETVEVEDAQPPIENYGGENLHMKGPYFKVVSLRMVPWDCRIRENVSSRARTITGVKQTEQFEGFVSYAIGYTKKSKYVGFTKTTGKKTSKVVVTFKR